jgi:Homing endonuclease associated repeat
VATTSGADIVAVGFSALDADEQEEAYARITDIRVTRVAGEAGETAKFLASLRRVADVADGELSPDLYRRVRRELVAAGEDVAEFNAVLRHFGTWRAAKEALSLSEVSTAAQIEARFRKRLVGKVFRYREDTLRATLEKCAADLGRPPLVVEFEAWRCREIELAKAQGTELFLPSDSPYRRRWGCWENALLHFGFTPEAVAERLEPGRERSNESLTQFQYR